MLCLHGVTGHGRRFRQLAEERLADHRVIGVDYRGHGRSGWEPPWSVEQHVADLVETSEALGISGAAWLGHSFGGKLVAELAARYPDRVERAVLLDPAHAHRPGRRDGARRPDPRRRLVRQRRRGDRRAPRRRLALHDAARSARGGGAGAPRRGPRRAPALAVVAGVRDRCVERDGGARRRRGRGARRSSSCGERSWIPIAVPRTATSRRSSSRAATASSGTTSTRPRTRSCTSSADEGITTRSARQSAAVAARGRRMDSASRRDGARSLMPSTSRTAPGRRRSSGSRSARSCRSPRPACTPGQRRRRTRRRGRRTRPRS